MAVIYITEADSTQHKFRLPTDSSVVVTIGREADCVIPMQSVVGISGLHCSIALVGSEYVITDHGSSNGTLADGRAISSEPLCAGVVYSIGNAALTFDPELPVDEPVLECTPAETAEAQPEILAEPIAVSEYAAPEAESAPAAPAPVKKKKVPAQSQTPYVMPVYKKKGQTMTAVNYLYVIIILALSFYAGMTLRHWMVTGSFLPEAAPAKAATK